MATESQSRLATVRELFSFEVYKRSQGRRLRYLTAGAIAVFVAWGLWRLSLELDTANQSVWVMYGVPTALAAIAAWAIFRLVNWPRFADFLIATEAEMAKVSWSTKTELKRATLVVVLALFLLSGFLLAVDTVWVIVLEQIGVLKTKAGRQEASILWQVISDAASFGQAFWQA
jgi:preprotein translocase subunit SecE